MIAYYGLYFNARPHQRLVILRDRRCITWRQEQGYYYGSQARYTKRATTSQQINHGSSMLGKRKGR